MKEIFSKENRDFTSRESIADLQAQLLQKHIEYVISHSEFYRKLFEKAALRPGMVRTPEDLVKLPTTSKGDLDKFNDDFLCIPPAEIAEYVTTSGTVGKPIAISLSHQDLDRLRYNEARALEIPGIGKNNVVQITTTLDKRFMAGMAYYLGATSLGAAVIRTGIGDPGFQWENILRFKPDTLIAVPSFIYKLASYARHNGINPNVSYLKKAVCIGEPVRNPDFTPNTLHSKILKYWNIDLYSTYASTEMATAFTECAARQGGHLIPELLIVEILDEKGQPVAPGELGEVTVTPLGVEAMPLVRFRTGDLARLYDKPCSCGRHTARLGPVEGRKQQMIKLKGTTIFPQNIENVLQSFESVEIHQIEISDSEIGTDHVRIFLSDEVNPKEVSAIREALKNALRVVPGIEQIPNNRLIGKLFPPGSRKPQKIVDRRKPNGKKP